MLKTVILGTAADDPNSRRTAIRDAMSSDTPTQDRVKALAGHFQAGRFVEAERLALLLTEEFPAHPFGWKVLGALLHQSGKLNESLLSLQRALALSPQDAAVHSTLGVTLRALGRLDEAETRYRQAISIKPDFVTAHYNLANTLREAGRLKEAAESFSKTIALNPEHSAAHNNLGTALRALDRAEEAERSYRRAISIKPSFAEAHYNLGRVLHELRRFDEAEVSYQSALALKPDVAKFHSDLATTLKELGKTSAAEASYQRALQLKPDDGQAKHMLAALKGTATARAPRDYVENLFDAYAERFDSSLVDKLDYKTPESLAKLIIQSSKGQNLGSVLDLGCGTGLFGKEIAGRCDRIVGLDVSRNMLGKAAETEVYDTLINDDIETYLTSQSLNFDYFVATDTFPYLGDLADVFRLIQSRNQSSAKLVFSVEHSNGSGYDLLPSGRYGHSKKYIEDLCENFHYRLDFFDLQNLRLDGRDYIIGGLYVLSF